MVLKSERPIFNVFFVFMLIVLLCKDTFFERNKQISSVGFINREEIVCLDLFICPFLQFNEHNTNIYQDVNIIFYIKKSRQNNCLLNNETKIIFIPYYFQFSFRRTTYIQNIKKPQQIPIRRMEQHL